MTLEDGSAKTVTLRLLSRLKRYWLHHRINLAILLLWCLIRLTDKYLCFFLVLIRDMLWRLACSKAVKLRDQWFQNQLNALFVRPLRIIKTRSRSKAIESGRHYSHEKGNHAQSFEYRLIEAVNVTQFTSTCDCNKDSCTEAPCEVVKELKLFQKDQSATKDIIVGFNNCMVKIPVATCQRDISCCDR